MKGADPYGASKAIRPWDGTSLSSYACRKNPKRQTHEYFEEVRGCLSCKLPASACDKCRGPKTAKKVFERELIIQDLRSGKNAKEVAKERGMSIDSVKYYEKRYADRIIDPCLKCRSKAICKSMGGVCNTKARWEGK